MSFFDDELGRLPPPESEPEPEGFRPPWDGPPAGVLPALVPQRAVLVRNDQMLVMVHDLRAYPTGLLLPHPGEGSVGRGLRWSAGWGTVTS